MVEKYSDKETSIIISKYLALDIGRTGYASFSIFKGQRNHSDTEILKAQDYIEKNYEDKITIDGLSDLVNVGRRTFERRFKLATKNTTIENIQRVRIEVVKKNFESSRKNISEVMFKVGYTDTTKAYRDVF